MRDGELRPGDSCDRYQIVRLIAAGGMGEVYEAVHEFTGRPVALKCLQLRHANKEDLKDRMKMEAVVLCRLRHANIVTVYDAGITDRGMVWIAMDLLVGKTLREILHRVGRLSIPQALYYACEIADGVDAAHELRVVHRDLKPENVFVTERNEVKVLDLGTAKFYGYGLKTTDRMRTLGTPAYMSPEHIQGTPVDARTDIYALGLILYEMLAGQHAYAKDGALPSNLEMGTAQLFQEPAPLAELIEGFPDYLSAIVRKAIAKGRDERFLSMSAFASEMRAARQRYVAEQDARGAFGLTLGEMPASKPGARRDYLPPRPPPELGVVAVDDAPKVVAAGAATPEAAPAAYGAAGAPGISVRPPTATVRLDPGTPPTPPPVVAMAPTVPVETTPADARSPTDPRMLPTVQNAARGPTWQRDRARAVAIADGPPTVPLPAVDVGTAPLRDGASSNRDGPTPPPVSSTAAPSVATRFNPFIALVIGTLVGVSTAIVGAVLWMRAHAVQGAAGAAAAAAPTTVAETATAAPADEPGRPRAVEAPPPSASAPRSDTAPAALKPPATPPPASSAARPVPRTEAPTATAPAAAPKPTSVTGSRKTSGSDLPGAGF